MELKEKIKAIRGNRSQGEFARLIGEKQQNIQRYESGTKPPPSFFKAVYSKLGVNVNWFFDDSTVIYEHEKDILVSDKGKDGYSKLKTKIKRVPFYGKIECGKPLAYWTDVIEARYIDAVDLPHLINPKAFEAKGKSMERWIYEGYRLICEDIKPKEGEPGVVIYKTDASLFMATLKYVSYLKDGNLLLYSENSYRFGPFQVDKKDVDKIMRLVEFRGRPR